MGPLEDPHEKAETNERPENDIIGSASLTNYPQLNFETSIGRFKSTLTFDLRTTKSGQITLHLFNDCLLLREEMRQRFDRSHGSGSNVINPPLNNRQPST